MESEVLTRELNRFNVRFATETDFKNFLARVRDISSRFTVLEEDNTLSGCFSIILGLVEQYKHELLAGPYDKPNV